MTLWQVLLQRTIFELNRIEIRSLFCLDDKKNTYISVLSQDCVKVLKQTRFEKYVNATAGGLLSARLQHVVE